MKKTILMTFIACLAFALNGNAQKKASGNNVLQKTEKNSTSIIAPAQNVEHPCSLGNISETGTGNKNLNPVAPVSADGFPVFINTGNQEQDMENYRIAKDAWIEQNPEKYKAMQHNDQSINK